MYQEITMNDRIIDMFHFMNHEIIIAGFDAEITDFKEVMEFTRNLCEDGTVQLLRAQAIVGKRHVLHATVQALQAFNRNENMANDLGLEICVRASAQRQISRALKLVGIKEGDEGVCAVLIDCQQDVLNTLEEFLGLKNNRIFEVDVQAISKLYDISPQEIKSAGGVEQVMIERTALLSIEI